MAFSVRARMALRDFLVPKVRPRVERAERACWCLVQLYASMVRGKGAKHILRSILFLRGSCRA